MGKWINLTRKYFLQGIPTSMIKDQGFSILIVSFPVKDCGCLVAKKKYVDIKRLIIVLFHFFILTLCHVILSTSIAHATFW